MFFLIPAITSLAAGIVIVGSMTNMTSFVPMQPTDFYKTTDKDQQNDNNGRQR